MNISESRITLTGSWRILNRPRLHNLSTDCSPAHVNWHKEDQDEPEAFNYGLMDYLQ
ncbi:MAG: hypothetical protein PHX89_08195 [bacterium]|nr:hypothetical protein [bacterium]MDD4558896.1 hypothetical protein [bacterium]